MLSENFLESTKKWENSCKIAENIKNRLSEIEHNSEKCGGNMKKLLIGNIFNEIIENDQIFGEVLKNIKKYYDDFDFSMSKEKADLLNSKKALQKTTEELCSIKEKFKSQTIEFATLKASTKLNEARNKEQIKKIKEENQKLHYDILSLERDLKKSKMREQTLAGWLKNGNINEELNCERESTKNIVKKKNLGAVEIGKNKVKVPRLDLGIISKTQEIVPENNVLELDDKFQENNFFDSSSAELNDNANELNIDLNYRKGSMKLNQKEIENLSNISSDLNDFL